jgi:hypothetical protein
MADNGDVFAADIDALNRYKGDLEQLRTIIASITDGVVPLLAKYPDLGGNGDIGKSFDKNYTPNAKDAVEFLNGLNEKMNGDFTKTSGLPDLFDDVNTSSTNQAGGPGRKG